MSETKSLRDRLSQLVEANARKPLLGSQISFAIRTVKEVLNGNGKASPKAAEKAPPGS
jgi:hypothetical protein